MTMIIQIVTAIALILSIILPVSYFFLGEKNKNAINAHLQQTALCSLA